MKKIRFIFLWSFIVAVSSVCSQQLSMDEAEKVANNFFGKSQKSLQSCVDVAVENSDTLFYVFNANEGFLVLSAQKKAVPVLAFSDEGSYNPDSIIPPVKMWLDYYKKQLSAIKRDADFLPDEKVTRSWKALEQPTKSHKAPVFQMTPLLTSKWGQGAYYNYYCPLDDSAQESQNYRVVTGCVATAMAQLMYYFRFPERGIGSYGYEHPKYGRIEEDFSQAVYNYSSMINVPKQTNGDISLLTYHCGVAVDMVYRPTSSGMYNHKAAYAMRTHFGFSPQTQYLYRDSTNLNWDSLIITHIDNKIPLYYAGWSDSVVPHLEGHAFICDAYLLFDSNDFYLFHFNFGWEGRSDAYFQTAKLYPSSYDFTLGQELIINAFPDPQYNFPNPVTTGETVLTEEAGSFADGSSIYDCLPGIDYTWIIQPEVELLQSITLNLSFQLAEHDSILVLSDDGKINSIFTNDTASANITTTSSRLRIRFITNNPTTFSGGLTGNYTTRYTKFCLRPTQYTGRQGGFDDGSGEHNYNNMTKCEKTIKVSGASAVTLHFSAFETEKDKDILQIFNNNTKELLLTLSGSIADFDSTQMTFPTNALALVFVSDPKNTYPGWALTYDTKPTGINDFSLSQNIIIHPNPVTDRLQIQTENMSSNARIRLYDLCGKLMCEQTLTGEHTTLNMSNLASGVYVLKIEGNGNIAITKKIIKQ